MRTDVGLPRAKGASEPLFGSVVAGVTMSPWALATSALVWFRRSWHVLLIMRCAPSICPAGNRTWLKRHQGTCTAMTTSCSGCM